MYENAHPPTNFKSCNAVPKAAHSMCATVEHQPRRPSASSSIRHKRAANNRWRSRNTQVLRRRERALATPRTAWNAWWSWLWNWTRRGITAWLWASGAGAMRSCWAQRAARRWHGNRLVGPGAVEGSIDLGHGSILYLRPWWFRSPWTWFEIVLLLCFRFWLVSCNWVGWIYFFSKFWGCK